jgi:hypothetical protein
MRITDSVNQLIKALDGAEQFAVAKLVRKAELAAENDPNDYPVITAGKVLSNYKKAFITRSELSKIVNTVNASGSVLKQIFAEELSEKDERLVPVVNEPVNVEPVSINNIGSDGLLRRAFESAMSPEKPYKIYSDAMAKGAIKVAKAELFGSGYEPTKLDIFAGNTDVIVVHATYDTIKGSAHVLVPVILNDGNPMFPDMFLGQSGFEELNKVNVGNHIKAVAGRPQKVDGQKLVAAFAAIKHGNIKKQSSEVEIAAAKLKLSKQASTFSTNQLLGVEIEDIAAPIPLPVGSEVTEEHNALSKRIASPDGGAKLLFGEKIVEAARNVVLRKIAAAGFGTVQASVIEFNDKSVTFAAKLSPQHAIKVPVKVAKTHVEEPKIAIAGNECGALTREGLSTLLKTASMDKRVLASVSASHGLTDRELFEAAVVAAGEGNIDKAEDALNVLATVNPAAFEVAKKAVIAAMSPRVEKVAEVKKEIPVSFMSYKIFFPEGA